MYSAYMHKASKIHIICGPTASGKSAYALEQAKAAGGVIINADSQQLYADLRVITARPTPEEEAELPHKLYGILGGDERADVAKWLKFVKMEIDWARDNGTTPYVVGGTGMYIHALMHGIADIPDVPDAVHKQAASDLTHMGNAAFHERLAAVDPEWAAKVEVNDRQRMLRGYGVWLATAKPLTCWQKQTHQTFYERDEFDVTLVEVERETLYARCDARVIEMMQQGAPQEVRALLANQYDADLPIMRVIGVPELAALIREELTYDEAIAQMQQATRNYAKRQMTWFRNKLQA